MKHYKIVLCALFAQSAYAYVATIRNMADGDVRVDADLIGCQRKTIHIPAGATRTIKSHGDWDITGLGCCFSSIIATKETGSNAGMRSNTLDRSKIGCKDINLIITEADYNNQKTLQLRHATQKR